MKKILIQQGRLIGPVGKISETVDILIENGKISSIGDNLQVSDAQVINAKGMVVSAGLVDIHVHLREPGFEYKETIETGCAAAARGGFTAIACMPNTKPVVDTPELVSFVKEQAAKACAYSPSQLFPRGRKGRN